MVDGAPAHRAPRRAGLPLHPREVHWNKARANLQSPLRKRCDQLDFSQPLDDDFVVQGGAFDPAAFWSTEGVKRRWKFAFDVAAIEPAVVQTQTGVLLQRRR